MVHVECQHLAHTDVPKDPPFPPCAEGDDTFVRIDFLREMLSFGPYTRDPRVHVEVEAYYYKRFAQHSSSTVTFTRPLFPLSASEKAYVKGFISISPRCFILVQKLLRLPPSWVGDRLGLRLRRTNLYSPRTLSPESTQRPLSSAYKDVFRGSLGTGISGRIYFSSSGISVAGSCLGLGFYSFL